MSDNKKWFKVWTSLLTDPEFDSMPLWCIGAWVKLGALVAQHGESGFIAITKQQFLKRTDIPENDIKEMQSCLLKVNVNLNINDNGTYTVSFDNWSKYQVDWNTYERVKKFRNKQNETVRETVRDKKRRDKEENKNKKRKDIYGEYKNVKLFEEELQKLKTQFGDKGAEDWIKKLDEGIEYKGYKYQSHYLTILKWKEKEKKEEYI